MTDLSGQYLGRYYLSERLGEGGMAVVYKAYDTRLERDVAIKIIRSGAFPIDAMGEVLKRFEREAKSLAKLSHPNIVKVHDYGEHEGSPYLVMEYLPGGTLKKMLGKPVPWQEAVRLILPVARGVAYAHQRGILHRDIKPANVLITESGEPMLSDFGIAKLFEGDQATALTGSGMAIGTPEYMAPEQWTGITSPQSDQYSLGIVLYEMVTGRKPYVADTPAAILIKQATEPLPNPRKFAVDLPEELELVLIKALAKEPEDRYKDLNAFIGALESLSVGASITSSPSQILTYTNSETEKMVVAPKTQKDLDLRGSTISQTRMAPAPKFSRKGIGLLISGVVVVIVAWLGLPLIGNWFSSAPVVTELVTATLTLLSSPIVESQTPEPVQITETPTLFVTPTEIGSPTSIPLPAEITDDKGSVMRLIPSGEFTMGNENGDEDEKPVHQVYLDSFYFDKYEVTNAQYKLCVDAGVCLAPRTGSYTRKGYFGERSYVNYPVIYSDWSMAKTYCEWRGARLPSEAEWEKAARGTDERIYPWGNIFDGTKVNFCDSYCIFSHKNNNFTDNNSDTAPVGTYPDGVSFYGIFDMAGNVSEWVADWYSESYYSQSPSSNPTGPSSGVLRVTRGGGWGSTDYDVRTTKRYGADPDRSVDNWRVNTGQGIRCAKDATQ
jgi:serine/threonine-protein kinase